MVKKILHYIRSNPIFCNLDVNDLAINLLLILLVLDVSPVVSHNFFVLLCDNILFCEGHCFSSYRSCSVCSSRNYSLPLPKCCFPKARRVMRRYLTASLYLYSR
ncbi:unnamed protein product [Albugo candida]|uniref:Uncharacterized protein n=1 Tax=Albugo candida TaxID=65357 RepID=A0A024FVW1_9STRA|nr:unnamed protein product [Albugo candida]|eukprot:CCI11308.1 unnamed protein product [Albugo candida]